MCVCERFRDPLGVKEDRSEVFVDERCAAQDTWSLPANDAGYERTERPDDMAARGGEIRTGAAVERRLREQPARPTANERPRVLQRPLHEISHGHERLDLRRSFIDRRDEAVAHVAPDVVLVDDADAAVYLQREAANADRAFSAVPLHQRSELAQIAGGLLVVAEQHEVLQHCRRVRESSRTRDGRLHVEQHLGDHRMLADRLAHLDPLRCVLGGLLERGRRDADALDTDAQTRLVHKRDDLLPPVAGFAKRRRARPLEEERARRRRADHKLVLGALDDIVVALAVSDEHAQTIETSRAGCGSREHDHEVALPRRDELLAALQDPAAVLPRRRRRREAADIGAGLRLGHRDRTHDLALREWR